MDVRKFADGKLPHERRAMPSRNRFEKKLCGTGSKAKQNKSGKVKQQKISAPKTPLDVPDDNVRVHCPNCKSILNVPKKYCGQRGKCKRCGGTLTVPTANNT